MNRSFARALSARVPAGIAVLAALVGGCGHHDDGNADGVAIIENLAVDCRSGAGAPTAALHHGPSGLVLHAPESWMELASTSDNAMQLVVSYSDGNFANVMALAELQAFDEADARRRLDDLAGSHDANGRRFLLRGLSGVATFSRYAESKRNCEVCSDPAAEMLSLSVVIANGTRLVRLVGEAPANTSKPVLCELQATMASATW